LADIKIIEASFGFAVGELQLETPAAGWTIVTWSNLSIAFINHLISSSTLSMLFTDIINITRWLGSCGDGNELAA